VHRPGTEVAARDLEERLLADPGGYPVVPHGDTYRLAARVWAELT
jgi:hypothetical protein